MQRQAVPLLNPSAPIVGTGIEQLIAKDSRVLLHAEKEGTVTYVDSREIHIKYKLSDEDVLVSFDTYKISLTISFNFFIILIIFIYFK